MDGPVKTSVTDRGLLGSQVGFWLRCFHEVGGVIEKSPSAAAGRNEAGKLEVVEENAHG